jgi:hypothetical protein
MNDECGYLTSSKNACEIFGVTGNTIRRWADSNKITYKRTPSNQRVYFIPTTINKSKDCKVRTKQNVIYWWLSLARIDFVETYRMAILTKPYKTIQKSWFSIKKIKHQNKNSLMIFLPFYR